MKELKGYNINVHTVALYMDNVCGMPFFVVRFDSGETFAGKSRQDAVDALDAACARASKEVQNG